MKLYNEYYGKKRRDFLFISLLSVSWETIYETLWIFIALTDMYGVLFVLAGRFFGVLAITWAFNNKFLDVSSKIGRAVAKLDRKAGKSNSLMF